MIIWRTSVVQVAEKEIANDFKPNINNQYIVEVIDKTTNEIILTSKHKNISDAVEYMSEFDLNKYSRKLSGKYIYLWES
jgi:hypothetical protein